MTQLILRRPSATTVRSMYLWAGLVHGATKWRDDPVRPRMDKRKTARSDRQAAVVLSIISSGLTIQQVLDTPSIGVPASSLTPTTALLDIPKYIKTILTEFHSVGMTQVPDFTRIDARVAVAELNDRYRNAPGHRALIASDLNLLRDAFAKDGLDPVLTEALRDISLPPFKVSDFKKDYDSIAASLGAANAAAPNDPPAETGEVSLQLANEYAKVVLEQPNALFVSDTKEGFEKAEEAVKAEAAGHGEDHGTGTGDTHGTGDGHGTEDGHGTGHGATGH